MNQQPPDKGNQAQWPSMLAALEFKQFRWLLGGNSAFFLAMQGQVLTRTVLAWDLTGQEMALAYINLVFAIPMLICSMIGGAISDRVERRRLVIIGQLAVIANEFTILVLIALGALEFWNLLVAATVAGIVIPFIMPARTAIVFNVVGPQRLGNAMALSGGLMNLSRVIGPAMMGFAVAVFSMVGAYVIAVLLYIISLLCMLPVRPDQAVQTASHRLTEDIAQGFKSIAAHRPLLICLLFGLIPMLLAMPFQNLLVVFADEVWHVGEQGLGILMGAAGLGGVLGSIWVAHRGESTRRSRLMVIATLLFGVLLILFSMSTSFYLALIPLILANACASASQTLSNTTAQLLVEDSVRGRMSAISMMAFGLTPLGVLPFAWSAQHIGAQLTTAAACVVLILVVVLFYLLSPTLRQLDSAVRRQIAQN
ncbi:MAG: MFS transporter [Pseudomonadales bacterium]